MTSPVEREQAPPREADCTTGGCHGAATEQIDGEPRCPHCIGVISGFKAVSPEPATLPASSPQEAGAPSPYIERDRDLDTFRSAVEIVRGSQLFNVVVSLSVAESVLAALASREAEVRRKVAEEIAADEQAMADAVDPETRPSRPYRAGYRNATARASEIALNGPES